jgi:tRNA A37 threonylcarbamoyladenosine dehydratase
MTVENVKQILTYHTDYIVDACDTVVVKKELLKLCKKENQKIVISTGTANKIDASKLEVKDLRKTSYDPIAKILRKVVREENLKGKIPVLASTEKPTKVEGLGSVSFVPSVAGLLITNYIVNEVIK